MTAPPLHPTALRSCSMAPSGISPHGATRWIASVAACAADPEPAMYSDVSCGDLSSAHGEL
jgi:hypothetical protein